MEDAKITKYDLVLISVHGLIRSHSLELGRDADTGGQTKYVVELAQSLSQHKSVGKVDLITRLISDPRVSPDYAQPHEQISANCRIIRIPCGPNRYIAKESLWPYLDTMADNIIDFLRSEGRVPHFIHGHYADAGYVAARVASTLDVPMAFTGHSLGRIKRQRLMESGSQLEAIERRYKLTRRIEAEEYSLDNASLVVASTQQEVEEQYKAYDQYDVRNMRVVPPGVDLQRFSPPTEGMTAKPIEAQIERFLSDPSKPTILALSRPDSRKNIPRVIEAFGRHKELRKIANFVLIAGNRDNIDDLDRGAQETWWKVLELVDRFDLYGSIAYPKKHSSNEVADIYRYAAKKEGVFVNAALTEPFGLTLLEAAASGLPVVATNDGGPRDIIARCQNGLLVDPLDIDGIGQCLYEAISDKERWKQWRNDGLKGVVKHYSWDAHSNTFIKHTSDLLKQKSRSGRIYRPRGRLLTAQRLLITDIDNSLVGKRDPLKELLKQINEKKGKVAFGIATGRKLELAQNVMTQHGVEHADFIISSVGTEIHYGKNLVLDKTWQNHINYRWHPEEIREVSQQFDGLTLQGPHGQTPFKVSFDVDPDCGFDPTALQAELRRAKLQARLILSHGTYLDLLPVRASKGLAVRYLALRLGIPLEQILVAGYSGNDEEMLRGNTLGVIVGNYDKELDSLRGEDKIYFAKGTHARGILEGIEHYNFLAKTGS